MLQRIKSYFWYLSIFLLIPCLTAYADEQAIQQRDIEIMEKILDRLIQGDVRTGFANMETRGTVLEGYGVIFHVPYSLSGVSIYAIPKPDSAGRDRSVGYSFNFDKKAVKIDDNARIVKIKEALTTFFADYAGTLGVPATERMTVVVELSKEQVYSVGYAENEGGKLLYASLLGEQLTAARRGQLNRDALGKAIIFSDSQEQGGTYDDINILANVFDTALDRDEKMTLVTGARTRGVYFPGFGVVFMASKSSSPHIILSKIYEKRAKAALARRERIDETDSEEPDPEQQELVEQLKDNFIELIAKYGGTLKTPKGDECILVMVETASIGYGSSNARMSLKAKMSDIRAVSQERITIEEFEDKVQVWEQ